MRFRSSFAALLLLTACDRGGREPQYPPPAAACDCQCPCAAGAPGAPAGPYPGAPQGPSDVAPAAPGIDPGAQGVQDLYSSASRKMNHGDGPGCLQDLDRLAASDPRQAHQMSMMRGQCEMLSGRCQEGKQRIDAWLSYQQNTPPEQRVRTVEAMAGMYCRGGNMNDRDRLLAAHHQLMQGAYMRQMTSAECQAAYQTARSLMHKVPPRDADDTQISSMPKSLFHTAANCFARAGDCGAARRAFEEGYPQQSLANIKDAKTRKDVLDSTFKSMVPRCKP